MPWTFLLYGLILPFSVAGLLTAVFANYKMQRLAAPTLILPERAKAVAMQDIEAGRDWKYWSRVMWMGVSFVVGPIALLMLISGFMWLTAGHRIGALPPTVALPLMLIALPVIFSSNRRRTQLLTQAGLTTSPTFSVEHIRKLEALKQTAEWRRASREAWIAAAIVVGGACLYGLAVFALIGNVLN